MRSNKLLVTEMKPIHVHTSTEDFNVIVTVSCY